jgi:hypothetical protein
MNYCKHNNNNNNNNNNRTDIIIENKKRENMHTDSCGNTCGEKCEKGSGKEAKIQEFVYRVTTNVESKMYLVRSYR